MTSNTPNKTNKIIALITAVLFLSTAYAPVTEAGNKTGKKLVVKFNTKRIERTNRTGDKELTRIITRRKNQLAGLIEYWEKQGDKTKAEIGRKTLSSINKDLAVPSLGQQRIIEDLEDVLDRIAFEKKSVISPRDMRVLGGRYVFAAEWGEYYTDGLLGIRHKFEGRSATVSLVAKGDFAHGAPKFVFSIADIYSSKEITLKSQSDRTYTFKMNYRPGRHDVKVLYPNDYWSSTGGDRNFFLGTITIVEKSWVAPK